MLRSAAGHVAPVGARLFRKAGGMPPATFRSSAKPLSGRYLSFAEREEIALLRVQGRSMREIGRRLGRSASTISRELRRNAATRSGGLEYQSDDGPVARRTIGPASESSEACAECGCCAPMWRKGSQAIVAAPSGNPVPGPAVPWKGRRHGPRKDRRWAKAWSPEQIARRLPSTFRMTRRCASATKPSIRRSSSKAVAHCAAN